MEGATATDGDSVRNLIWPPQPKRSPSSSSSSRRVVSTDSLLPSESVRSKIIACWPPPNAARAYKVGRIHHGIGHYFMSQTRARRAEGGRRD